MPGPLLTPPIQGVPPSYDVVKAIQGALSGEDVWGRQIVMTTYDSDADFAVVIKNRGAGGGLDVQSSGGFSVFQASDAGVEVTSLLAAAGIVAGGAISGASLASTSGGISSAAGITAAGTIVAGDVIQGLRYVATVATGTAPLTVVSTTMVANLNVERLGGHLAAEFALLTGADFTGPISVMGPGAGNDQSLFLRHGPLDGTVSLGATDSATPDMILKNNAATQIGRFTTAGVFHAGSLTAALGGDGDALINELFLWADASNYRKLNANGSAFQLSGNANVGIHMTVDSLGTMTIPGLVVDVDAYVGGDFEVGDDSIFNGDVSMLNGLNIPSGTFVHENSGVKRLELGSGGLGAFGATPVIRQTIVGNLTAATLTDVRNVVRAMLTAFAQGKFGFLDDSAVT